MYCITNYLYTHANSSKYESHHTVTVLFMVSLFCVVEPRSIMVMAVSLAV